MSFDLIQVKEHFEGEVGEIIISQPPANIITAAAMGELSLALKELQASPQRKLIMISGEGKHFSFGASVEEHQPDQVNDMLPGFHKLIGEVLRSQVPTMAKVSGFCLGGGFELAMACTFIGAHEKAKFAVPEIQLAVFPPVACALLPTKLSGAVASEMILSGEQWDAESLKSLGLVNFVSKLENFDEDCVSFFENSFQAKSAHSLRIAHQASQMTIIDQYESYIGKLEDLYLKDLMSTKDAVEGINSFIEKRKPKWENT